MTGNISQNGSWKRKVTSKMSLPYSLQVNLNAKPRSHRTQSSAPRQPTRDLIVRSTVVLIKPWLRSWIIEMWISGCEKLVTREMDLETDVFEGSSARIREFIGVEYD